MNCVIENNETRKVGFDYKKDDNQTTTLSTGNQNTKLDMGAIQTEAMQSIELKVDATSIKLDSAGVTINGVIGQIEGTAMAQLKSPMTTVSGDGMLTLKGGIAMIN